MDVSDIVESAAGTLNSSDLANSFFCLSKSDPTVGFTFDATKVAGHTYPGESNGTSGEHLPTLLAPLATWQFCDYSRFCKLFVTRRRLWRCGSLSTKMSFVVE